MGATDVKEVLPLAAVLRKTAGITFVMLRLKDGQGRTVSHNVYWMAPRHDFTGLRQMPGAKVDVKLLKTEDSRSDRMWTLQLSNVSGQLAFFLNPQVIRKGEEVLPSFWSDNYFSIPAHGTVTVTVSCPLSEVQDGKEGLRVEGWNLEKQEMSLGK
jgi:Ig-like domain-containing protein